MIFWASLISIIWGVLWGFALGQIIWALIGIYLLFEIRSYFK
jgi:hypothetical protein